jgi:sRNA-binding carbon storage regulator CsrA
MLVLTQRPKDGPIHIIDENGNHLGCIQLLGINGQQARYGFDFNDEIEIQRDVVHKRMIKENNDD